MTLLVWTFLFAASSLACAWLLRWGGAEWLEGWKAAFFIDWMRAADWSAEQIKLWVLLTWGLHALWFVLGLAVPLMRFQT